MLSQKYLVGQAHKNEFDLLSKYGDYYIVISVFLSAKWNIVKGNNSRN